MPEPFGDSPMASSQETGIRRAFEHSVFGTVGIAHGPFPVQIDEKRRVHTPPKRHRSSGGMSACCASSRRASTSSPATGRSASASRNAAAVGASSRQCARLITREKDSFGERRADRRRSYASRSIDIVFVATMHGYMHADQGRYCRRTLANSSAIGATREGGRMVGASWSRSQVRRGCQLLRLGGR